MASKQRGALLLVVWPRVPAWQIGALIVTLATIVFVVWSYIAVGEAHPFTRWGMLLFWIGYFTLFAFPRPLRFYENGVWYLQLPTATWTRFVPWEQLDRYQFEGDILILTGTESTLKGGPVGSGVFHLRPGARSRVEPILARYVPAKSTPT